MGRKQEIVTLRSEVAYWRGLYEGAINANLNLEQQLLSVINTNPTQAIIKEVMAGFKAVMNPESPPGEPTADPYGETERWLAQQRTVPDPAWELDQELGPLPDGHLEELARDEADDA
jgi:hypothetical protein